MDVAMREEKRVIFAWIDLEMTGLNPDTDVIVEIATVLTTPQLEHIAEGPSLVIHQPESRLQAMEDVVTDMHQSSGLLDEIRQSEITCQQAQRQTIDFLYEHYDKDTVFQLAGNSVHQDRAFLRKHMPQLSDRLHYRIVDVSTIKSLVRSWYPEHPNNRFEKQEEHRARDDIYESIAELCHYRKHFFV